MSAARKKTASSIGGVVLLSEEQEKRPNDTGNIKECSQTSEVDKWYSGCHKNRKSDIKLKQRAIQSKIFEKISIEKMILSNTNNQIKFEDNSNYQNRVNFFKES